MFHKKALSFNIDSEPNGPLIAIFSMTMWLEGLSDGRVGKINMGRLDNLTVYKSCLLALEIW